MSVEQIIDVPENGKVIINIPESFKQLKRVRITINELDDTLDNKIALLKKSATDPFFVADMEEVNKDFEFIESKIDE
jgi:hypothetical protein